MINNLDNLEIYYIDNLNNIAVKYDKNKNFKFYSLFMENRHYLLNFLEDLIKENLFKKAYLYDTVITQSIVYELNNGVCIQFSCDLNRLTVNITEKEQFNNIRTMLKESLLIEYIKKLLNKEQISIDNIYDIIQNTFKDFNPQQVNQFLEYFGELNKYNLSVLKDYFIININNITYTYVYPEEYTADYLLSELEILINSLQNTNDIILNIPNNDENYVGSVFYALFDEINMQLYNELNCSEFDYYDEQLYFSADLSNIKNGGLFAYISKTNIQQMIMDIKQLKRVLRMFETTVKLL